MGKKIIAVVAGLVVHTIVAMLLEFIGHNVFPAPDGAENMMNLPKEEAAAMMANMEPGTYIFMIVGWALGAFLGAAVASKILPSYWKTSSFAIGVVVAIMVLLMVFALPHPTWVTALGLILPVPMAYLGGKMFGGDEVA